MAGGLVSGPVGSEPVSVLFGMRRISFSEHQPTIAYAAPAPRRRLLPMAPTRRVRP